MHSPVNWALLGLVIERPSYAYELAQRFERTYEPILSVSSVSHIYTALAALKGRELVQELPGNSGGRQPKPRYEATAKGLAGYAQWLVGQAGDVRRRQGLFVLQLAMLARDPQASLHVLDRYEQACLAEAQNERVGGRAAAGAPSIPGLAARLSTEERRLDIGAKLEWVAYARRELSALADTRR